MKTGYDTPEEGEIRPESSSSSSTSTSNSYSSSILAPSRATTKHSSSTRVPSHPYPTTNTTTTTNTTATATMAASRHSRYARSRSRSASYRRSSRSRSRSRPYLTDRSSSSRYYSSTNSSATSTSSSTTSRYSDSRDRSPYSRYTSSTYDHHHYSHHRRHSPSISPRRRPVYSHDHSRHYDRTSSSSSSYISSTSTSRKTKSPSKLENSHSHQKEREESKKSRNKRWDVLSPLRKGHRRSIPSSKRDVIMEVDENEDMVKEAPKELEEDEIEEAEEEEKLIEARRKRRQEILLKHQKLDDEIHSLSSNSVSPIDLDKSVQRDSSVDSLTETSVFLLGHLGESNSDMFSADYNPNQDGECDRGKTKTKEEMEFLRTQDRRLLVSNQQKEDDMLSKDYMECQPSEEVQEPTQIVEQSMIIEQNGRTIVKKLEGEEEVEEEDMFAAPSLVSQKNLAIQLKASHIDNWDDPEGYYRVMIGEVLDHRYQVTSTLGKGVFSVVVKARDSLMATEVAIKIVRNNDTMYKAGQKEAAILQKLMEQDPLGKKHIVRLLRYFEHRSHLCMVFESMSMNLREVLKKYGNNVGLNIKAVRLYAHQIFLALCLLRKTNIIHADLKPDNILANESKTTIKVCDLGSACDASENDITPYLVSRFYRAPEIILGLPYDFAVDIWSAACTLYEMFTGKILFPGRNNNQMLKFHMELKGKLSHKMIKRGQFGSKYFDENWNFCSLEFDKLSNKEVVKLLQLKSATRDLKSRLPKSYLGSSGGEEDQRMLQNFIDLLDKCLQLNPEKRLSPLEALRHPFITGKS